MAVTLARALAICALIEQAEAERAAYELARATHLTSPTVGRGKRDGGLATRRARREVTSGHAQERRIDGRSRSSRS